MKAQSSQRKPNILLLVTDQQRAEQHWPEGWAMKNLPAMRRLMQNGITFNKAYANTCMCSPSRASLFTSAYPAHNGVTEVLSLTNAYYSIKSGDTGGAPVRDLQGILKSNFQNLAHIMDAAGYNVVYKGKWHLTKPVIYDQQEKSLKWTDRDIPHIANQWGFKGWNPPDAGDTLTAKDMGGGKINNDGRFVDGHGTRDGNPQTPDQLQESIERSAVHFLNTYDSEKPFCLIVSLVNPHDVLSYPGKSITSRMGNLEDLTGGDLKIHDTLPTYVQGGYKLEDFEDLPIELPPTWDEDLSTKPVVQQSIVEVLGLSMGVLDTMKKKKDYVRFYAYLHTVVDAQIMKVLDALDANGLTDDTLVVRVSDHGELGLAHGGQRQKMSSMYEEAIRIPMIFSNPKLFPEPVETDALAGLIDVLPTLAEVADAPRIMRSRLQGTSLTSILVNPDAEVQDHVHFTYDDWDSSYPTDKPAKLRAIIFKDWKYAVYFDDSMDYECQYEMYNLATDPYETENLAHPQHATAATEIKRQELHRRLLKTMAHFGTHPDEIIFPYVSGIDPTATHPANAHQGTILSMFVPGGLESLQGGSDS